MTKLQKPAIDFVRHVAGLYTSRPLGVFLFTNKQYPDNTTTYSLAITNTEISITNGTTPYTVTYAGKTSKQVAQELSNSPYPIEVKALADIQDFAQGEISASGTAIPDGFNFLDISADGKSAIVRSNRYSVQYNKLSSIGIKQPYLEGAFLPWWARITNGFFIQLYKGIFYHFGTPEYDSQVWSTSWGRPFVDTSEPANFISKSVIKTNRAPVLFRSNNITIVSANGDRIYSSDVVKDVDTINGYIYLNPSVTLPKDVVIYYTYLENGLLYKDINLNGHFSQNPYILDKYVVFYCVPIKSNSGIERERGVYHSIGTSIDDAIFKITTENINEPIAIIGAINIRSQNALEDINVTDTRSFGGGLRDDKIGQVAEKKFKESQYFFDIGHKEGIPYPGAASVIIELPPELKEVMSIAEIRERVTKFLAAGVYPVVQFTEEDYYLRYQPTTGNVDVSLMQYSFSYANTGYNQDTFGQTGKAAFIVPCTLSVPTSGLLNSGYVTTGNPNATLESNIIRINPGEHYQIAYLKGSPDAVFSYEQKTISDSWERKTVYNTRSVGTGQLSTQFLVIESPYSYKEIRNLTGFAPYVVPDDCWENISYSTARIIALTRMLSSPNVGTPMTGYMPDVFIPNALPEPTGDIGIKALIEPIMVNYNVCLEKNFFSGLNLMNGVSRLSYFGTTGNTFPFPFDYYGGRFGNLGYSGQYDALRDIHALARLSKHYTDDVIRNSTTNVQSLSLTGASTWIEAAASTAPTQAFSGAFQIANKVISLSPFTGNGTLGSDTITQFYNPYLNTAIRLSSQYGPSEIGPTSNLYLNTDYVKSFAALYASQTAPWSGNADYGVSLKTTYNPKMIAISGIAAAVSHFENYFISPTYSGNSVQMSWMTTFNKVSTLGSRYLDNVCNAIDYLYYGNKAWAGWTGYEAKRGTYYNATYSNDTWLSGDRSWSSLVEWPDLSTVDSYSSLARSVTGVCQSLNLMEPYVRTAATQGGVMPPGFIKAVKHYLWQPIHYAKNEPLFTSIDPTRYVETFEMAMGAAIKGCFNEDGIVVEGGSFGYKPAPFTGSVPSDLFDACGSAIKYYRLSNNHTEEMKWTAIANGILNTTNKVYLQSGGYPFNTIFSTSAGGDPGSVPLKGLIKLMDNLPEPLTDSEFLSLTGKVPRYFR